MRAGFHCRFVGRAGTTVPVVTFFVEKRWTNERKGERKRKSHKHVEVFTQFKVHRKLEENVLMEERLSATNQRATETHLANVFGASSKSCGSSPGDGGTFLLSFRCDGLHKLVFDG